jgi:hypothetical protein
MASRSGLVTINPLEMAKTAELNLPPPLNLRHNFYPGKLRQSTSNGGALEPNRLLPCRSFSTARCRLRGRAWMQESTDQRRDVH